MAFFSKENLEAVGIRDMIRICTRCYEILYLDQDKGYCCPKCGRCWIPQPKEQDKTKMHPAAVFAGGAIVYKGESKGRKRKKAPKKSDWAGQYGDS